ncbi:MAG: TonB-dependent receptor, partial [Myxococcales bacterium]|nr:TonB-dependent receptor [Myxococcales bacterium]
RGATESPRAWGRMQASTFGASAAAGFAMGDVDHQLRGSVAAMGRWGEPLTAPELGTVDQDRARALAVGVVGAYAGAFAQVRFYRRERTLPFAPYGTVIGSPDNTAADTLGMLEGGYTRELSTRLTATARLYANAYRYRDRLVLDDGTFTDIGDSRWGGGEARGRYAVLDGDRLGVTAGAEVTFISTNSQAFYYGAAPDEVVEVPKAFNLQGLYTEIDAKPLPWLALTAGVRADRNSALDDRVSPRAALFASRDRYGAKLLYAEGFRNPSAYEGFFEDGVDFIANPDIGAETIRSYEAVVWARPRPGLTTRLSAFRWTADRLVEQDTVTVPMVGDRLQFDNRGRLQSTGLELEASYRDADGWLAFGGGTLTQVEDGDGATAVGAPGWVASAGLSSPLVLRRAHLSTEVQAIGARSTRVDGVRADAFVAWNVVAYLPSIGGFDVTLGVRNLLGQREAVPAPEDYDRDDPIATLPGEGRELYARLGYRY